jgi:hypothetical protein
MFRHQGSCYFSLEATTRPCGAASRCISIDNDGIPAITNGIPHGGTIIIVVRKRNDHQHAETLPFHLNSFRHGDLLLK